MTAAIDEFIADARAVSIENAAKLLELKFKRGSNEHMQPCPRCGGRDRFSFNTRKNVWNCRHCGEGGRDGIGMVAFCREYDLRQRADFMEVCSILTGRDIPEGEERESEEDRAAREKRIEDARRKADAEAEKAAADAQGFRDRERQKARGIVERGWPVTHAGLPFAREYLKRRGCGIPDRYIRVAADVPYWHGQDERGKPFELFSGPAMVAPFIAPVIPHGEPVEPRWDLIGCHITWIDLDQEPKFRPALFGLTDKGAEAGLPQWRFGDRWPSAGQLAAELYEPLPTKKMRGTKQGGMIPLAGSWRASRWCGGEGIENGLAFARWEGFRDDTFYFAAGDLGNLAGPADPASRFPHPTLTKMDRRGVARPVMVQGPQPLSRDGLAEAIPVAAHVRELVLLGDGDSEPVMTAAAMVRARKRHAMSDRSIFTFWPRRGSDFSGMAVEYDRRETAA